MVYYFDDFIRIILSNCFKSLEQIDYIYIIFTNTLGILRNNLKDYKGTIVEVLNIEINIILFEVRFFLKKLRRALALLTIVLDSSALTLNKIKTLASFLLFYN